jgi:hypothetical protein
VHLIKILITSQQVKNNRKIIVASVFHHTSE